MKRRSLLAGLASLPLFGVAAKAKAEHVELEHGIMTFPAAAQSLHGYEEGTWTSVNGVFGEGASGRYQKIGKVVTITGTFILK